MKRIVTAVIHNEPRATFMCRCFKSSLYVVTAEREKKAACSINKIVFVQFLEISFEKYMAD